MKKPYLLLFSAFALNANAAGVPGLSVDKSKISWPDTRGWMHVQDSGNYQTVQGCEGFITSCTTPASGVYQVTDHTNGFKSTGVRVNADSCTANYSLPSDGAWYQLQEKQNYSTVCQTSGSGAPTTPCSIAPGTYQLVEYRSGSVTANDTRVSCDVTPPSASGLSMAGMQSVNLGNSNISLGSVTAAKLDSFMSPLSREYALQGGAAVGVGMVAGKRALQVRLSPANATNSQPTNRANAGYYLPPSRTYRVAMGVYIPSDFDGGGTKDGRPYGTGKLGPGLFSNVEVSGGKIDPRGFSMRFAYDVDASNNIIPAIYDYSADRPAGYIWGIKHVLPNPLVRGQWNYLYMEVTSNSTASKSDGRIRAWQGSSTTPVLNISGKKMIASGSDTRMSRLKFGVFMGGSGDNAVAYYSPGSDQTISFTDIFVGPGTW